ncbi:DUF411 domain-containing protein [Methyloversatilis sp.]|uniref:DUF411 domain-containing protein n=1 Tax=Methyloversatilis sp. TaxID=2569862 RepID=UPI00273521AB|nr:DUF411 domain-containing protein [Methyloversatilis sp.]MDP3454539.1 DUF411 domain-containing protein [Methyloversatilis sp.]MDP3579164.1 DUF411 domain-containing protein [Methyloversatilis sp.]
MNTTRRTLLNLLGLAALLPLAACAGAAREPMVEVWKSPTCGCCKDWIAHMEANGFIVKTFDTGNNDMRAQLGMPVEFGSCHTARVGEYVLEGHVPASDVRRLLMEKPKALGLAVPAMPIGSPGMDGPEYKGRKDPYDVLLVQRDGAASVYRSYR